MSKHIYHISLEEIQKFIEKNQSILRKAYEDKSILEYYKTFGKSYYLLELEKFMQFLKIDKNIDFALKNIKYFSSEIFLNNLYELLHIKTREELYILVYTLKKQDKKLLDTFFQKLFLHFYTSLNINSNINIDYIDLAKTLAKNKNIKLKESFGENGGG